MKTSAVTALLPLVLSLASCTIGFDRQWRAAAAESGGQKQTDLSGAWEGTWKSGVNGHEGRLRAVALRVAPQPGMPAAYQFRYEATWKKILSACVTTRHEVTAVKPGVERPFILWGEKDLGLLGGVYRFTGTASPSDFRADYKSEKDHGVFEMKRPASTP